MENKDKLIRALLSVFISSGIAAFYVIKLERSIEFEWYGLSIFTVSLVVLAISCASVFKHHE